MHRLNTPTDTLLHHTSLQKCIDALARGECSEDEFLSETLDARDSEPTAAWDVLSCIDQRYRRGLLSSAIFYSIKSRISKRAIYDRRMPPDRREAVTIKLFPTETRAHSSDTDHLYPEAAAPVRMAQPERPPPIDIGRILRNRYVVEGVLGRGGMGDVFKAVDGLSALRAESHSRVAVKVLREGVDQHPDLICRLQREFDCTRRLSHPNVVKVYEFDRSHECAYYTMELLEGEHVGDLLERQQGQPLPRPYAWAMLGAVGAALAHAHSRNVIHGDVSPKNIMVTNGGEVRVLDFGSSTMSNGVAVPAEIEVRGAVAATPAYASCELLEGQRADPRDDLYALACVAYELLAGRHPFQGKRSTEARELRLRAARPPGLTPTQWRTIRKGLSWTRERRSIPVRQWLGKLGLEPDPERLPVFGEPRASEPQLRSSGLQIFGLTGLTLAKSSLRRATQLRRTVNLQRAFKLLRTAGAKNAAIVAAGIAAIAIMWRVLPAKPVPPMSPPSAIEQSTAAALESPNQALAQTDWSAPTDVSAQTEAPAQKDATAPADVSAQKDASAQTEVAAPTDASAQTSAPPVRPEMKTVAPPRPVKLAVAAVPAISAAHAVAPAPPARQALRFSNKRYMVEPGAHFVETHVWRSHGSKDRGGFVWWTDDAGAKAGIDFVGQLPTPYAFSRGRELASLFVRLLPNAARSQAADFHVCVGKSGTGEKLTDVTCSSVLLPVANTHPS